MKKVIGAIVAILLFVVIFKSMNKAVHVEAKSQMEEIQNQVADDAVKQYEIAKRQGDKTQIWVQAQLVSAAYLQAKDEANYQKWKAVEKQAGKDAGMPE